MPAGSPLHFDLWLPPFALESGSDLPHLYLRGWWWGPETERDQLVSGVVPAVHAPGAVVERDADRQHELKAETQALRAAPRLGDDVPTVLVIHALTADAVAGGPHGWWSPLVGSGAALDPESSRILCFNNLGSCYGTFGPSDPGFPTVGAELSRHPTLDLEPEDVSGKGRFELPPDHPAPLTTWDQARALWLALDRLGVRELDLVTGGSLGGMIALAMAALCPDRVRTVAPIAASIRSTPWIQGWNHTGRSAILADPGFPDAAHRGLEVARQIAHMTYRAEPGLLDRQRVAPGDPSAVGRPLPVQTYLQHQGRKLRRRFEARAYLAQLSAMDQHDLLRRPPEPNPHESWAWSADWSMARLSSRIRAIGIDSDQLFFPQHLSTLAEELTGSGGDAKYIEIRSPHGHDAFLIEWDQMDRALRWARSGP